MAGRKDKNIVDYFPHYCIPGKTLFILESKFKHLGYSIWFKTLELLGSTENHYIDLRSDTDLLFLISKMKITEQELNSIYDLLAKLGAIDKQLWENRIVFSENFIKNISDVYKRRNKDAYSKDYLCEHILNLCIHKSKKKKHKSTKERKVKESKVKYLFDDFWNEYHLITDKKKTDKDPTQKYWNKLTETEKGKAHDNIKLYFDSLSDKKYCKKARTYLSDKNFNDEFKVNGENKEKLVYTPPPNQIK